jgi:hypothetical protein
MFRFPVSTYFKGFQQIICKNQNLFLFLKKKF